MIIWVAIWCETLKYVRGLIEHFTVNNFRWKTSYVHSCNKPILLSLIGYVDGNCAPKSGHHKKYNFHDESKIRLSCYILFIFHLHSFFYCFVKRARLRHFCCFFRVIFVVNKPSKMEFPLFYTRDCALSTMSSEEIGPKTSDKVSPQKKSILQALNRRRSGAT